MTSVDISNIGTKYWFCNNQFHRSNGPAYIRTYGYYAWYNNGQLHRLNGPAIVYVDEYIEYWVNVRQLSEYELMFITGTNND